MLNRWGSGLYNRMDDGKIIKDAPKKSGFKGKRPKSKFSKNARKGADVKGGHTYKNYRDEVKRQRAAGAPAAVPSPTQRAIASVTSRAAVGSPRVLRLKEMQHLSRTIAYRIQKKLAAKEVTVKKAKADSVKFKAATRKSHRAKERLERALQREMDFRHEDAHAAQEKLRQERHEFQLCLKAAISEVTRGEKSGCSIAWQTPRSNGGAA
eukprot:scaffold16259_cov23-Cyclotella_meneghiniana.AAC.2